MNRLNYQNCQNF